MKPTRPIAALVCAILLACVACLAACDPAQTYKVTLDFDNTKGSVSLSDPANGSGYVKDEEVIVTVTPNADCTIGSVKANGVELTAENGKYSFAVAGDTTVSVTFESDAPSVTYYQVHVTAPAAAEGSLSVSPSDADEGYVAGEKVTITVTANEGYALVAVKVNNEPIEAVAGVYSFEVEGETTVSAEFVELIDFLDGKEIFGFASQSGYSFADGKATALATGSEAVDYVITASGATIGNDVAVVKNADGTLTIDDDVYYFVGVAHTVTVKEGSADVVVVFTIESVEVQNAGMGDEYTVTFAASCKYGDNVCTEVTSYAAELTMSFAEGANSYQATVDLVGLTATKVSSGVSLFADNGAYRLDIDTGNANRFADFYQKVDDSYQLVKGSLARQSNDDEYYWEAQVTDGDVSTTYTIKITGAKWGDPASLDDYSEASITVTKVEKASKTVTATGSDSAEYEVTFMVENSDISIYTIKKGGDRLYDLQYNQHQTGESLVAVGDKVFRYSYSKSEWDKSAYTYKDNYYVCTITITDDSGDEWTMTVDVDKLQSKTFFSGSIDAGDGVCPYESITILYGSDGKPTGIAEITQLILGEGEKKLTGTSTVEEQGDNVYVITLSTATDGEIKLKVTGTGPNFSISLITE